MMRRNGIRHVGFFSLIFLFQYTQGQGGNFAPHAFLHAAKGSLSGQVTDQKNKAPLPGATIYIPDLKLGAAADSGGFYHFSALPKGSYLVQVHYIGYKTVTRQVEINDSTIQNFELPEFAIEESPVVVTGLSKAMQIKRSPVPIVAISHEFIATHLSTNIIDAIAKVPGVNALTTGPNVSKPFIRGLGYNRILTLYDGVRQEGQQWGDEHGVEVDQYGVERIEIIKGPSSLTYGSDALAGVVNMIPTQPAPEGKLVGDILAETESNNGLFGGSLMLGSTKNGFEWMGRISHKQATNYQNKIDGRVYNTAFNETDFNFSAGLHNKWGYSHLNFSLFDDLQEIPDGSRDSATRQFTKQITEADLYRPIVSPEELRSYHINPLHQHVQHERIYATNNFTIGASRLIFNAGFQRSVRREFSHPEESYQDLPGLYLQLNTWSYDLKYFLPEYNGWEITFGLNGMYQVNQVNKGTEFIIPAYRQFDAGPFAMAKKSFGKLDISGGIRYDTRSFTNDELFVKTNPVNGFDEAVSINDSAGASMPFSSYHHIFSGVSGSLGATWNFSEKLSAKTNISRGYRAPNISEISSNGVHPGTNIYQVGNPEFKPEFSLQEDIGIAYSTRYVVINLSVFNNTISNYIFNQRLLSANGGDSVLVPGNQTYKFQQARAELYGGEASIDIHPVNHLHFENSLSVVYALNRNSDAKLHGDSSKYLPFIPPLHGISELRFDFASKAHHITNGFLKLELNWFASQNRIYSLDNTETETPGYVLVDAGLGVGITNRKDKLLFNISLMANNIFDVAYQDHLSRLKYFEPYPNDPRPHHGIYNMGRNIALKIDFPLKFELHEKEGK